MKNEKKTLVILAFHQTKIPKKKLKKVQREITDYLTSQYFNDFLVLKQDKKGVYLRFDDEQKKTYSQTSELKDQKYESYLYLNCSQNFVCADYKSFCQEPPKHVIIGLSYEENGFNPQKEALHGKGTTEIPFIKEKILYFSKEALPHLNKVKKEAKFLFGKKVNVQSNKALPIIRAFNEDRRPCLFLDRDGIIIKDKGYLSKVKEIEFIDGIFDLIRWANEKNWYVIVMTNQSGIGQGLYSEEEYRDCERYIEDKFREKKLLITKTYFSPYHKDAHDEDIKRSIYTRKPFPGMLLKAAKEFPIDLQKSLMVGDKRSDELIEVPLNTLFLKGAYPLSEHKKLFSNLEEILEEVKSFSSRPLENNLTTTPLV